MRGVHDLNHAAKQPVFARIFARWIAAEKESVSLVSFRTMPTKFATFSGCRGLRARGTRGGNTVLRAQHSTEGPYPWRQHSTEGQPRGVVPRIKTRGSGTMAHMHGTIYMAHEMHVEKAE